MTDAGAQSGDRPAEAEKPELDYRFSLANERTFLAWSRTALGLLAGGVAVQTLADRFATPAFRAGLAVVCCLLAAVIAVWAVRRWREVDRLMRSGERYPLSRLVPILAFGITAVAVAAAVAVIVT